MKYIFQYGQYDRTKTKSIKLSKIPLHIKNLLHNFFVLENRIIVSEKEYQLREMKHLMIIL